MPEEKFEKLKKRLLSKVSPIWMRLKAIANIVTNFKNKVPKYTRYALIYSQFWGRYRASYLYTKVRPYRQHALVTLYGVALVVTSFSFADYLSSILQKDAVAFFTSAGAMFGGIIAIFFSVSTLLMQSAAQSTSAGFYRLLGRDFWQEVIYWAIALFAVVSFSLALVFSSPQALEYTAFVEWVSRFSILTIGTTFLLLFVLYFRIYERIDPRNGIIVIRRDVGRYMARLAAAAEASSTLMSAHPSFDPNKAIMAKAAGMSLVKNNMSYVSDRLDHLFDYHNKLVKSEERKSARIVIDTVVVILQDYFRIVSGGSLLVPSAEFILATRSDSEKFLTPHLQALVSAGVQYMAQDDEVGTSHIVWKLCHLALSAGDIKYATYRNSESPIFSQCVGYLTQLTDVAIEKNSLEGVFQAAQAYEHIAAKAVEKGLQDQLPTIYASLNKIAHHGLVKKHAIVWQQVANTYAETLKNLVITKNGAERADFKIILENYQETVEWAIIAAKAEPKFNEIFFRMKMEEVFELVPRLTAHLAHMADPDGRRGSTGEFFELVEENRRMLRGLSENMQSADHYLLRAIGNNIRDIGLLLLELLADPKWERDHSELLKQLGWYIHQPGWFIHYTKGTINFNNSFVSLVDAIAKIGIQALDNDQLKTAEDAVEILSKMATDMLEKEKPPKYGYTEPRIMVKVCYIGILALKNEKTELLKRVQVEIKLFENAYKKKWFSEPPPEGVDVEYMSPKEDQLSKELLGLRDKIQKRAYQSEYSMEGTLDLPEDWIAERVSMRDFDMFTLQTWNFFITPSPLDDEIKDNEKE